MLIKVSKFRYTFNFSTVRAVDQLQSIAESEEQDTSAVDETDDEDVEESIDEEIDEFEDEKKFKLF